MKIEIELTPAMAKAIDQLAAKRSAENGIPMARETAARIILTAGMMDLKLVSYIADAYEIANE